MRSARFVYVHDVLLTLLSARRQTVTVFTTLNIPTSYRRMLTQANDLLLLARTEFRSTLASSANAASRHCFPLTSEMSFSRPSLPRWQLAVATVSRLTFPNRFRFDHRIKCFIGSHPVTGRHRDPGIRDGGGESTRYFKKKKSL